MATQAAIMFQNDAEILPVGTVRGWKVGFGYVTKGTVVVVYVVDAQGVTRRNVTEIPLLGNGKADVNSVTAYLTGFGVVLTNAVKQVIGA